MADMNFHVFAVDYADACLALTKEKMDQRGYEKVTYLKNTKTDIPLEDESMDCAIAWGALFCCNREERYALFGELYRVLKKGGLFFADFRTKSDFMYGRGSEKEEDFFVLDDSVGDLAGFSMWFATEQTIRELYRYHGFEIVNIEREDFWTDNLQRNNSHYHVWAKK